MTAIMLAKVFVNLAHYQKHMHGLSEYNKFQHWTGGGGPTSSSVTAYMASRCAGGGVFTVSTKSGWRSWYRNFSTICQHEAFLGVWLPREPQGSAEGKKALPASSTDVGKSVLPASLVD